MLMAAHIFFILQSRTWQLRKVGYLSSLHCNQMDRSWIKARQFSSAYINGVKEFMQFVRGQFDENLKYVAHVIDVLIECLELKRLWRITYIFMGCQLHILGGCITEKHVMPKF